MQRLQNLADFKTGHPEIDDDHAKLADIINAVFDSIRTEGGSETCMRLLDVFLEEAKRHFIREEQVLLDLGFPGLKRHSLYHDALLDQALGVRRHCDGIAERQQLRNSFEEMARFFIDDVVRGDMEFVPFLQERGLPRPSEN